MNLAKLFLKKLHNSENVHEFVEIHEYEKKIHEIRQSLRIKKRKEKNLKKKRPKKENRNQTGNVVLFQLKIG